MSEGRFGAPLADAEGVVEGAVVGLEPSLDFLDPAAPVLSWYPPAGDGVFFSRLLLDHLLSILAVDGGRCFSA